MIHQRDLLLVPFPFSDQSGKKVRPVVVISNDGFNNHSEDVLVIGVTSIIKQDSYSVLLSPSDIEEGVLRDRCCAKVENIIKIDKKLIIKKIGLVKLQAFHQILRLFKKIIES